MERIVTRIPGQLSLRRNPVRDVASAPDLAADVAAGPRAEQNGGPSTGWIWWFAFGLFVLYSIASIRHHLALGTHGYDLGIFEQDVRSWSEGRLPTADLLGPDFPRLGNHFSPILALLATPYRLFPSPITLLVAQGMLLAVAVVPIASWAQRALGRGAAIVIAAGYGLSWGIAHTVEFDFHEVAFAVPLLAFSACALGQRRAKAAVGWALPLLLVKEDLGLTVVVIGLLVWLYLGQRRLGWATIGLGVGGMLAANAVLTMNRPGGGYDHSGKVGFGQGGPLEILQHATVGMVTPEAKATLLVLLLAPTAFLALRSPLVLLAVPTLAWRLYSDWWPYFNGHYHYNTVLMPILFAALVHALVGFSGPDRAAQRQWALVVCATVTALMLPANFLASPFKVATWRTDPHVTEARAALALVPDGAVIATTNNLAPHLTGRATVSIYGWTDAQSRPDWILVDRRDWAWPHGSWAAQDKALQDSRATGFADVASRGDFVLLHRSSAAPTATAVQR